MPFKIHLTKREQVVLLVVASLLVLGWAVKCYRLAHPTPVLTSQNN